MISAFIARSSFWKGKKWAADLDAQLQGELDTETLKTTRRLSAPFPSSFLYCNKPLIIFETSLRHSRTLYDLIWPKPALMTNRWRLKSTMVGSYHHLFFWFLGGFNLVSCNVLSKFVFVTLCASWSRAGSVPSRPRHGLMMIDGQD